jgi:hypothetical protein
LAPRIWRWRATTGESRVPKWLSERPGVDQDEFIEDIPFPETNNYGREFSAPPRITGGFTDRRRPTSREATDAAPAGPGVAVLHRQSESQGGPSVEEASRRRQPKKKKK